MMNGAMAMPDADMRAAGLAMGEPPPLLLRNVGYADLAARLLGFRGKAKAQTFAGKEGKWQEWKYKMQNLFMMLEIDHEANLEEDGDLEDDGLLDHEQIAKSKFIFGILVQL
jgi:hypothetical protein